MTTLSVDHSEVPKFKNGTDINLTRVIIRGKIVNCVLFTPAKQEKKKALDTFN